MEISGFQYSNCNVEAFFTQNFMSVKVPSGRIQFICVSVI